MSSDSQSSSQEPWIDPLSRIYQCSFYTSVTPFVDHLEARDFHVLTTAEKNNIFARHLPSHLTQEQRGKHLLKRLKEVAPSILQHFYVKHDPKNNLTMRLWAQRETVEMREDSYIALSYCWDTEKYPPRPGVEYPLPISPLMFSALAAERGARTTGVWIDQLCIDQKNKKEKAISVGAMDAVYRCARWVVVALLDIEVHLAQQKFLRDFIKDYENPSHGHGETPHKRETPPYLQRYPVLKRFFYTILGSRWFTRAWCSHEMEIGENHLFYIPCQPQNENGEVTEMFSFTATFLWDMLALSAEVPCENDAANYLRDKIKRVFDMRQRIIRSLQQLKVKDIDDDDNKTQSYTAQIGELFELGAGGDADMPPELRKSSANLDKTSIVLNVLGTGLGVVRHDNTIVTESDSLRRLMVLSLAADDPTVLCTMGQHFNFSSTPNTLSWLCKSSYADLGSGAERRARLPPMRASLFRFIHIDQSTDLRWITLDVFALGVPRPPAEKYRNLAASLTQKCIELGMGRGPPGPFGDQSAQYAGKTDMVSRLMAMVIEGVSEWGPGPLYQYWQSETFVGAWRERFNWTLACALECGIPWMLETAKRCGYPEPWALEAELRLFSHRDDFRQLEHGAWQESENDRGSVDAMLRWANWAVNWGVNRPYGRNTEYMPMLLSHGNDGNAMVFTVADALVQIVMPCPLIPDDYARLFRIWLLQAKDDPWYEKMHKGQIPEWFLRSKALLFTDVTAKDAIISTGSAGNGMPGWRLRQGVKVHGPPDEFQHGSEDFAKGKEERSAQVEMDVEKVAETMSLSSLK